MGEEVDVGRWSSYHTIICETQTLGVMRMEWQWLVERGAASSLKAATAEAVADPSCTCQGPSGKVGLQCADSYQCHDSLCQPVVKPLGAGNQPQKEYLCHGNLQTLQVRAFVF